MSTLPTNHSDGTGEVIAASIINTIATQVNANTTAIAAGSPPSGAAGGALANTYPNPTLAPGAATGTVLGPDVVKTSTPLVGDITGTTGATTIATGAVVAAKIATGAVTAAKLAAGAATGAALGSDVATKVGGLVPIAQLATGTPNGLRFVSDAGTLLVPSVGSAALSSLTDATITLPATTQELIYNTAGKWVNISHKRRLRGYAAFVGDGSTDDSTAVNQAISDASLKGYVEYPAGVTVCQQNVTIASNVVIDGNDSIAKLVNSAASGADVFRTTGFNSLTGGGTTGGVYRYTIKNIRIDGNRSHNASGRHGIASYGIGNIDNVLIHDCHGSAIWAEWSSTASELSALSLADGDQSMYLNKIHAYDCDLATTLSGADATIVGGITGVSNLTNPTITTAQYHLLRAGQTVTISGVVGATGVNGTFTVLGVASATTFTVTHAAPGVYSSGGAITTPVSGMITVKGMDSPHLNDLEIYQTLSVVPGSRGILVACSGTTGAIWHVYQNFPTAIDLTSGNNTQVNGIYCGGHDQGILIRQNNVQLSNWYVDGSFNNSVGLDYQSVGGGCHLLGGRVNGLTSGSYCVRLWNTSFVIMNAIGIGDGGSNTSTLYTAPNGTGGFHGFLYNGANGVNASPASLIVTT